jgi:hypothetical protein
MDHEQMVCENLYLFGPDKYIAFKPLQIDLCVRPVSKRKILLVLKADILSGSGTGTASKCRHGK